MPDSPDTSQPPSVTNTGPGAAASGGGVAAGAGGIAVGGNVYGGITINSVVTPPPTPTPSSIEPQPDSLASCLIRIFRADGTPVGAGFLAHDRQALTCAHVVGAAFSLKRGTPEQPAAELQLDWPLLAGRPTGTARVIRWLVEEDIAVLELSSAPPSGAHPVALNDANTVWGHAFRAFGFPKGYDDGVWASGILRAANAQGWVQMEGVTAQGYPIRPGFSGGPVWDETLGAVVGLVVQAEIDETVKAALMIPAKALRRALGEREIASAPAVVSRPANPFHAGGRLSDPRDFFGRERLLREIKTELVKRSSVALVGESQMGKSSLLYYLYATRADWLTGAALEYIDLQRVLDEADFCETVLRALGEPGDTLRHLKRALESRPVILLLDEVERLAEPDFTPRLHDLLRSLGQEPHFAMLLATQRPLEDVFPARTAGGVSPFHNIFTRKTIGPFTEAEARAFLALRLAGTGVAFTAREIERLLTESHGHPARLQAGAKTLFEEKMDL